MGLVLTGAIVGNRAARVRGVERGASWQGQETLRPDASSRAGNAVAVLASTWAHHGRAWPVSHAFVQATWLLTRTTVSPVESFNYELVLGRGLLLKVVCFLHTCVQKEGRRKQVSENAGNIEKVIEKVCFKRIRNICIWMWWKENILFGDSETVWNFELSFHFETFKGEKKRRRKERVVSKDFFQKLMIRIGSRNKLVIAKIESRVV